MTSTDDIIPSPHASSASPISKVMHQSWAANANTADEDLEKGHREATKGIRIPQERRYLERYSDNDNGSMKRSKIPRKIVSGVLDTLGVEDPDRQTIGQALAQNTLAALGIELAIERAEIGPILQVIELSFDGTSESLLECFERRHLDTALKTLPIQGSKTARIFLCRFHIRKLKLPGGAVFSYLNEIGVENVEIPKRGDISNSARLVPQWLGKGRGRCLGVKVADASENVSAYMQCIPFESDKLIVVHSFPSTANEPWKQDWSKDLLESLLKSNDSPVSLLKYSSRPRKEVSKLLVLNFLANALRFSIATLDIPARFIKDQYRTYGYRSLSYTAVEGYNDDSSQYETLVDTAQDLADAIEFVISSISNSRAETRSVIDDKDASGIQEDIFENIRGECAQLKKLATRIQAYHERRYNLYVGALNIHESQSVKRLTALATGFLPLSLGASLLSMQTRFADLDFLLYDFVGVGLILFFLMFIFYALLKLVVRTARWKPFGRALLNFHNVKLSPEEARKLKVKERIVTAMDKMPLIFIICAGIYTTITFLVGMFDKVSLGLKLWGYGAAGGLGLVIGFVLLVVGSFASIILFRYLRGILRRKESMTSSTEHEGLDDSYSEVLENSDSSDD